MLTVAITFSFIFYKIISYNIKSGKTKKIIPFFILKQGKKNSPRKSPWGKLIKFAAFYLPLVQHENKKGHEYL